MAHYEFSGTLGECLSRFDDYLGLKDLSAKAKVVIDIEDRRKSLEAENTEFDYGHNVKHYSED